MGKVIYINEYKDKHELQKRWRQRDAHMKWRNRKSLQAYYVGAVVCAIFDNKFKQAQKYSELSRTV